LPVSKKSGNPLPLNPQVDVGIRGGADKQDFCVIAVAVVPLGADQANSAKIQTRLQQEVLRCIETSLKNLSSPEMTDTGKRTDTDFDQSDKDCVDCCSEGKGLNLNPGASLESPSKRTIDLAALEQTFTSNSALLLATLVDAEASRRGLDVEGFARALARSINPEPSAELTQRFKAQLEDLSQRRVLPEDAAQRLTLLTLLANNLKDFEGRSFEGDVDAMLAYLGAD
jgi:hypothetical protein